MPSLKRPMLNGIIQPMHVGIGAPAFAPFFAPLDGAAKNPQTFELHLWLLPANTTGNRITYQVHASEGPLATATKAGLVWSATDVPDGFAMGVRPIKILDGYAVRGNVYLTFSAFKTGGGDPYPLGPQLWGYFLPVGQGSKYEQEHRFVGNQAGLAGFNSGVPNVLTATNPPGPGTSAIIHNFEPNRIDEISLAFPAAIPLDDLAESAARLTFEDVNNLPLIPGHYVDFPLWSGFSNPGFIGSDAVIPGVAQGQVLQSPYTILGTPFGGGINPALHHLRVQAIAGESITFLLSVHGYYIRH
jgi:hypothetical protein